MTSNKVMQPHIHTVNEPFIFLKKKYIFDISTVWGNIDGCIYQYRCAIALYLLPILVHAYDIIIDCCVGAPEHGKDVVYGIITLSNCLYPC